MLKNGVNLQETTLFIVLLISILPIINLFGYDLPILYLLIPMEIILILAVLFGKVTIPRVLKTIMLLFILIIFEIFISTFIGSITLLNRLVIPTDSIQYIARFLCMSLFILWVYQTKIRIHSVIKLLLITFNIAMLIGVLQWIPWPGQTLFINLYKFREGIEQISQLNREMHLIRVHGVGQMATANGGVATFLFIFAYSIKAYYKRFNLLAIFLMILSIINLFASQSRAGMIALVFSFIIFYLMDIYIKRKSFKSSIKFGAAILLLTIILFFLYWRGNPFILRQVYRWNDLLDNNGGARSNQIDYALSLLTDLNQYVFGISRVVQNYGGIKFYIEVEPVNIFVLYGALGFILQYSLVAFLLWYFIKAIRKTTRPEILGLLVASFIGLLSYQVFSIGYFFFREIRIGLLPWIFMGISIGFYERNIKYQNILKIK